MIVGVLREIKPDEYRVAMLPSGVEELTVCGHRVLFQRDAGNGSGISNQQYEDSGAEIVDTAAEVFAQAELIVKVKEPQESEWPLLRRDQALFTYFHFAADERLTKSVLKTEVTAIAYETLRGPKGDLPLLTPMSEVAGRMSIQEGAKYLERPQEVAEFCWVVFRASNRHTSSFLAVESSEKTQRRLPPDSRRTS